MITINSIHCDPHKPGVNSKTRSNHINEIEPIHGGKSKKIWAAEIQDDRYVEDEFSYIGALLYIGEEGNHVFTANDGKVQVVCTVSLLNENYVLTSAHCIVKYLYSDTQNYGIVFSMDPLVIWRAYLEDRDRPIPWSKIDHVDIPDDYNVDRPDVNNIGIIRLKNPINLKEFRLKPMNMSYLSPVYRPYCRQYSEIDTSDVEENRCFFYGYGPNKFETVENQTYRLKRFAVPILDARYCRSYDKEFDAKQLLCTGHNRPYSDGSNRALIGGDSGGPFACHLKNLRNESSYSVMRTLGIGSITLVANVGKKAKLTFHYFTSIDFFREWIALLTDPDFKFNV